MEVIDHMGVAQESQLGYDPNCYNLVNDDYLGYCKGPAEYCATTLRKVIGYSTLM